MACLFLMSWPFLKFFLALLWRLVFLLGDLEIGSLFVFEYGAVFEKIYELFAMLVLLLHSKMAYSFFWQTLP